MAKKNILVDIDFNQNQLLNPVLQNLPEDPSTGVEGQKYFNTTNHIERTYRNGAWQNTTDEYELPAASTDTRGGIKVGNRLYIENEDVLNVHRASKVIEGIGRFATDAEVEAGTQPNVAIDPVQLKSVIDSLPTPMQFKGTLGSGGTITVLPTASSSNIGFLYLVISDGTYDGQSAKAGDEFISNGTNWILIPSGDEPAQIQADWNQSDNTALDYIKNKPTVPGAGTFIVILSGTYGNLVSDKTFLEISAAVSSGQSIVIILPSDYGNLRIAPVEYHASNSIVEFYGYRKQTTSYDYTEQLPMPYGYANGTRIYFHSNETVSVDLSSETVIGFLGYPSNTFRPTATIFLTESDFESSVNSSYLNKGYLYKTTDTNKLYLATSKNTVQEVTSIQSDWSQSDNTKLDYIKNKPDLTVYKTKQTAVVDPTASGTTLDVIDTITQNENGVITATKKTIQSATEAQKGVAELATSAEAITGTDTERIMTPKTVKDAHDSRHWFGTKAEFDALSPNYDANVIYHVEQGYTIPQPTVADAGKLLSVSALGDYELITIVNSELVEY